MKNIYKIIIILSLITNVNTNIFAEDIHFINFKKVLNESIAGKDAQSSLKKKLNLEILKYKKEEEKIKKEESELIKSKNTITKEDYEKKIISLRNKVTKLRGDKQKSFDQIAKMRVNAKNQLLAVLNPIIGKYMEENKIKIVLDKKSVLLGQTSLEITSDIIEILNKDLKKIKVN